MDDGDGGGLVGCGVAGGGLAAFWWMIIAGGRSSGVVDGFMEV